MRVYSNKLLAVFYYFTLIIFSFRMFAPLFGISTSLFTVLIYGLALLLFLIDITYVSNFHVKKLFLYFLVTFPLIVFNYEYYIILALFIFIYIFRNQNVYKGIKIVGFSYFVFIMICLLLVNIGVLHDTKLMIPTKSTEPLHSIWGGNPNNTGALFGTFIFCIFVIAFEKKRNHYLYILAFTLSYYIYKLCGCRTFFMAECFLFLFSIFLRFKVINRQFTLFPIFLLFLTFLLMYLWDKYSENNFVGLINLLLTGRPILWLKQIGGNFSLSNILVGQARLKDIPQDSSYLEFILLGGLPLISIFIVFYLRYVKKNAKVFNKSLLPIQAFALAFFVSGFSESLFPKITELNLLVFLYLYKIVQEKDLVQLKLTEI